MRWNKKNHLNDLGFKNEEPYLYVYNKDGSVFSGTAWNSDEKTIKIDAEKGMVTKCTIYHNNGNIAAYIIPDKNSEQKFFGERGNEISQDQFEKIYETYLVQTQAYWEEMKFLDKK